QRVETLLDVRARQELDQLPGLLGPRRAAEQDQAGATGDARSGAVRPGQRHRPPLALEPGRLPAPELADVPWPGQVEDVRAAEELVPYVGDLGLGHLRCPAVAEHGGIEVQRPPEARALEVAAGVVLAQQRIVLLQGQGQLLLELV